MLRIQIIEDETLQDKADFDNAEVWLLSKRQADSNIDSRINMIQELADSELPSSHKFPQLMTELYNRNPVEVVNKTETVQKLDGSGMPVLDENGMPVFEEKLVERWELPFTYEVLTHNKENFAIHAYVCDENSIKVVSEDADNTDGQK